ncbi:hypothetical protein DPEC_G00048770, partial [Dallia pectoralis]
MDKLSRDNTVDVDLHCNFYLSGLFYALVSLSCRDISTSCCFIYTQMYYFANTSLCDIMLFLYLCCHGLSNCE